ncbi:MAG: hypothetical protein IPP74_09640 [Alphaproteobacteria bacterium]|nr:hypothetical protein [Alphaproteobacteria bacterium]
MKSIEKLKTQLKIIILLHNAKKGNFNEFDQSILADMDMDQLINLIAAVRFNDQFPDIFSLVDEFQKRRTTGPSEESIVDAHLAVLAGIIIEGGYKYCAKELLAKLEETGSVTSLLEDHKDQQIERLLRKKSVRDLLLIGKNIHYLSDVFPFYIKDMSGPEYERMRDLQTEVTNLAYSKNNNPVLLPKGKRSRRPKGLREWLHELSNNSNLTEYLDKAIKCNHVAFAELIAHKLIINNKKTELSSSLMGDCLTHILEMRDAARFITTLCKLEVAPWFLKDGTVNEDTLFHQLYHGNIPSKAQLIVDLSNNGVIPNTVLFRILHECVKTDRELFFELFKHCHQLGILHCDFKYYVYNTTGSVEDRVDKLLDDIFGNDVNTSHKNQTLSFWQLTELYLHKNLDKSEKNEIIKGLFIGRIRKDYSNTIDPFVSFMTSLEEYAEEFPIEHPLRNQKKEIDVTILRLIEADDFFYTYEDEKELGLKLKQRVEDYLESNKSIKSARNITSTEKQPPKIKCSQTQNNQPANLLITNENPLIVKLRNTHENFDKLKKVLEEIRQAEDSDNKRAALNEALIAVITCPTKGRRKEVQNEIKLLKEAGADLNMVDDNDRNLVQIAILLSKPNLAMYLINKGVNLPNGVDILDPDQKIKYPKLAKMIEKTLQEGHPSVSSNPEVAADTSTQTVSRSQRHKPSKITPAKRGDQSNKDTSPRR